MDKKGAILRYISIAFIVLLVTNGVSNAQLMKQRRLFYVRGSIGYGSQSLEEVNNTIEESQELFRSFGIPVDWETFGGALNLGGECGFNLSSVISIGVGVDYQNNKVDNSYTDFTGNFSEDATLTTWDITGNITFWIPSAPGLFVGVNGGIGFGTLEDFLSFQIFGDPLSSFTIDTQADGNGLVGGVFIGYQADFVSGPLLFGKVGYRLRNLGPFEGSATSPEFGPSSGKIRNDAGQVIDFDFTGVYLLVGFGWSFGTQI